MVFNGTLNIPELSQDNDVSTRAAMIVSLILSIVQLVSRLFQITWESIALSEEPLIYMMSKITALSRWIPY